MDRICSMYGVEKRCKQSFSGEKQSERDHLEEPGVDGSIILKWSSERLDEGGAWSGSIWLRAGIGGGLY
jgi:hypothetical protein